MIMNCIPGLTVDGCPHRLVLEETHGLNVVLGVRGESVVNSSRQDKHIALLNVDSDPHIVLVSYIKETRSIEHKADFLVLMQVSKKIIK